MKSILIIGGGSIGKRHARNLLALGEKDITIVELKPERGEEIKKELGVEIASSLEVALQEKHFDIAFVCSPSVYHLEQARICAEHDTDLFIEKPLSHTMEGIEELARMVQERKLVTMIGSNWKFYPLFQKMKALLENNAIGKVLSARCQFGQYLPDWHPWEDHRKGYSANKKLGGGILLDSHEFDYLTWFLGDVEKLACFAERVGDVTVDSEDAAEIILRFTTGAIGEIHLDYLQRFYQRNFEFFGESGTIIWDTNAKNVTLLVKDQEKQIFPLEEGYDINQMYIDEVKHFFDCVKKRNGTMTPVDAGVKVVRLITAAKESAENNSVIMI